MAKKKKQEEHGARERWAVPYADFLSLLLALFIALFTMIHHRQKSLHPSLRLYPQSLVLNQSLLSHLHQS
ncbi:MAG: hypothetical protein N2Z80_00455 [Hydrogenothermaceae bacterium]|nr:hypothetical protein [Hydrogenothermaceae bacterium]